VVDRCRQIGLNVSEVQFSAKADRVALGQDRNIAYANKRAEMWGHLREWLLTGAIDKDPDLIADLTGVEYGYVLRDGRDAIQLERKEDMKRRGLASPDNGDALALTFAYPVAVRWDGRRPDWQHRFEYEPFAYCRAASLSRSDYDPFAEWRNGDRGGY